MLGMEERARAQAYRQLASVARAGLPLAGTLERLERTRAGRWLSGVRAALAAGEDVGGAFARAPGVGVFEAAVVEAGSTAGALPEAFEDLADLCEERARAKARAVLALAYPLFLLHAAVFLPSCGTLVAEHGGLGAYLLETLLPLLGLYGAAAALWACFALLGRVRPRLREKLLLSVPVVGAMVRAGALAVGLRALGVLYRSGVPLGRSLARAAEATPSLLLREVFDRAASAVSRGEDLAQAFAREGDLLPGDVRDLVATGSRTGELDTMLERAAGLMKERAAAARTLLLVLLGGGAFALVAVFVAVRVIGFYADLYSGARLHPF